MMNGIGYEQNYEKRYLSHLRRGVPDTSMHSDPVKPDTYKLV